MNIEKINHAADKRIRHLAGPVLRLDHGVWEDGRGDVWIWNAQTGLVAAFNSDKARARARVNRAITAANVAGRGNGLEADHPAALELAAARAALGPRTVKIYRQRKGRSVHVATMRTTDNREAHRLCRTIARGDGHSRLGCEGTGATLEGALVCYSPRRGV